MAYPLHGSGLLGSILFSVLMLSWPGPDRVGQRSQYLCVLPFFLHNYENTQIHRVGLCWCVSLSVLFWYSHLATPLLSIIYLNFQQENKQASIPGCWICKVLFVIMALVPIETLARYLLLQWPCRCEALLSSNDLFLCCSGIHHYTDACHLSLSTLSLKLRFTAGAHKYKSWAHTGGHFRTAIS